MVDKWSGHMSRNNWCMDNRGMGNGGMDKRSMRNMSNRGMDKRSMRNMGNRGMDNRSMIRSRGRSVVRSRSRMVRILGMLDE